MVDKQETNMIHRLWQSLSRAYFFYSVSLGVAVLEPWERNIFHGLLLIILLSTVYTTYIFLPGHLLMLSRCLHDFINNFVSGIPSDQNGSREVSYFPSQT